jgi:uncharacterized OsmC-like protein
MDKSPDASHAWTMRVRWVAHNEAVVYARNNSFSIGQPASFRQSDPHPSAVEYLLGALGGDLANGFQACASERGVQVDDIELKLSGRLHNPLVYLGVIGETGDPGFAEITGTLYVSADADEDTLKAIWQTTLERSPIANTLKRGLSLRIDLRQT